MLTGYVHLSASLDEVDCRRRGGMAMLAFRGIVGSHGTLRRWSLRFR